VLAILRWAENPRDAVAGLRALQLHPGIGPATARNLIDRLSHDDVAATALARFTPPAAAFVRWPGFCRMIERLRDVGTPWTGQVELVREWYQPQLERLYDYVAARAGDLDQLEQIAAGYVTRERFLTELTLDPPDASGAEAGRPQLDEDYLILSTIHSAKGQEWDAVFVLDLVDGCIPSDMANRAMRDAFRKMRHFLMATKGLTEDEAISLMSVAVDFGVTQVVDANWGIHAILKKAIFAGEAG
jgi:ATP-dependent DNA helicase UvrD/PcrA